MRSILPSVAHPAVPSCFHSWQAEERVVRPSLHAGAAERASRFRLKHLLRNMAAPVLVRREFLSLARILGGLSHLGPPASGASAAHKKCDIIQSRLPSTLGASFHTTSVFSSTPSPITLTDEPDALFQKVSVLVKSHDKAVLDSYEFFATMAATELGINIGKVFEPPKDIDRLTLLKSIHIFKKHMVQYEMRTHYRCIELSHVTGSTTRVYLEYIQRNLPESVAMQVTKTAMEKIPDHIHKPMWNDEPTGDRTTQ